MEIPWINMLIKPVEFKAFQNLWLVYQFKTFIEQTENNAFGKLIETPMTCWLKNQRNLKHFWIHDIFKFEESGPFSYACRNFHDELRFGSTFAYVHAASPKLSMCADIHIIAYV